MRKIKEILRLRYERGLSGRAIATSVGCGETTVRELLARARAAGLTWPLPDDLDDSALERRLYPPAAPTPRIAALPSWSYVHKELMRKGVTRQLLWEEYRLANEGGLSYSQFCELYGQWLKSQRLSMRQTHKAGEKLYVDFAGTTIAVVDRVTGGARQAQLFVAAWGASQLVYAEAVWTQDLPNWTVAHVNAFNAFGCVPWVLVPDNLRSGVKDANYYEPEINETYLELALHYSCAVIPARKRKPKDKAKVENAVLLATRWMIAVLRNRRFFSLDELNEAIIELTERLNNRPLKKLDTTRQLLFDEIDRPAAQPLPARAYEYAEVFRVKPSIDYHVEVDKNYYSVPYKLRTEELKVRLTAAAVEVYHRSRRVWTHTRVYGRQPPQTVPDHMPSNHRIFADWTPSRLVRWASSIGPNAAAFVEAMMRTKTHPEQAFRASLGVIRLADKHGKDRADAACQRAMRFGTLTYRAVQNILDKRLEGAPLPIDEETKEPLRHANIRGSQYYRQTAHVGEQHARTDERKAGENEACGHA